MLAISVREAIRDAVSAFGDDDPKERRQGVPADAVTFASPATPERVYFAVQRVRSARAALLQ
jgi:xanthine dehydrogenase molybdopterin-binding subunit B